MLPSWSITGTNVELGGFRIEWAGDSLKTLPPPPPPHASADSPTVLFRKMSFDALQYTGDPKKAARAFLKVADLRDPPLRVQFGTESMATVLAKAKETAANAQKYADIAHSTNADSVDKDSVLSMFSMYIAKTE